MGNKKKCTFAKLGTKKLKYKKKKTKCMSAQERHKKLQEWKGGW